MRLTGIRRKELKERGRECLVPVITDQTEPFSGRDWMEVTEHMYDGDDETTLSLIWVGRGR